MSERGATDAVIEGAAFRKCSVCLGSGRVRFFDDVRPAQRHALTRDTHQCDECGGVGFIPIPDGHGIYRTADVEALVEFYAALVAHEDALLSFELHGAQVDRLRAAAAAITPELLARCRKGSGSE